MRAASLLASLLGVAAAQMQFESEAPSLKIRGVNLGGWLVLEKRGPASARGFVRDARPESTQHITPQVDQAVALRRVGPAGQEGAEGPVDARSAASRDDVAATIVPSRRYCETLGPAECKKRLEKHWDSWVSEQTIADLAAAGITHVRVPMGHWITCDVSDDEPYVCGEWSYLVRAMGWCRAHGIKVWLDLHTAPGSQNGFDNSGRLGAATWDSNTGNVNRTVAVVEKISQRVKDEGLLDVVTGFGLLNEPDQHIKYWRMLHYYNDAYAAIRSILGKDVAVYIGDMFNPQSFNWFWPSSDDPSLAPPNREAENVFLDSHIYACFVDDLKAMTPKQHITQVCKFERDHINQCCWQGLPPEATELKRFVGEWTVAYDQTPSPELEIHLAKEPRDLSPERFRFLRQYALAQMMTYEATPEASEGYLPDGAVAGDFHGWFFWNFRMEADAYREWDYLRGVQEGWIPVLVAGETVEETFGVTCADLEEDARDCTTDVVEPFPPLKHWRGVPCVKPTVLQRTASAFVYLLAWVGAVALATAAAYGAWVAARAGLRKCKRAMGYAPLTDGRRKEFTEINGLPPALDVHSPINVAA